MGLPSGGISRGHDRFRLGGYRWQSRWSRFVHDLGSRRYISYIFQLQFATGSWGVNPPNPNAADSYPEGLINVAKLGSNPVPPSDTTPPTCAISSPSSGVTASGTITVSVSASDNLGVSSVQLYVDGILRSTDSASPYSFAWDTTSVGNGSHSLMAKALDAGGNSGTSASL